MTRWTALRLWHSLATSYPSGRGFTLSSWRLRIRARDVAIATSEPQGLSIRNQLPGTIAALEADEDSGSAELLIDIGGPRLRARLTLAAVEDLGLREGLSVYALVKSVGLEGSIGSH